MTRIDKKRRCLDNGSHDDIKRQQIQDLIDMDGSEEVYSDELDNASDGRSDAIMCGADTSNRTEWLDTLTKVVKAVVSVQFSHVSNFDTETAIVSEATGFVVDIERGLVLTNRHVVGPGPFCGYIVFDNHEEVVVKPIYRDPIHDFGFLQFNPKEVKYMELCQLDLKPEHAKVGTEIRVIGNDAGEKLSILAGFISRLDRNAPEYGAMTYNDFNTEYIQAAASASGGSSGSPVIDENGNVVALQAGGSSEASTDFFLPVHRPLRTLRCIQKSLPVTRGDIQVEWLLRPFDECRRLGLSPSAEAKARAEFPDKIGLLTAEIILPEGPADGLIKEGDTLISINDTPIATCISVDEILDANVGKKLKFTLQRGRKEILHYIEIGDLHSITPDRYVDVAGASFNEMSYQIARCYCLPVKGVYVNNASGSFELTSNQSGWILESIDNKPTPNLDSFIEVMKSIPDRQKVSIACRHVSDLHSQHIRIIYIERHWQNTFRLAVRNDLTGLWDFSNIQDVPLPPIKHHPQSAKFIDIPFSDKEKVGCSSLVRSFVQVRTVAPISLDCYPFKKEIGYGVVIDADCGYVLVSRRFVPHDICDIFIIFAESIDVPGKVIFLHPTQNYAIVQYDPKLVLADVRTPKFAKTPLRRGDTTFFVGYNYNLRLVTEDVKVSAVSSLNIPPAPIAPRYKGTNLECIILDSKVAQECDAGVLADNDGTLRSFWLCYLGESGCDYSSDVKYRMGLDVTDVMEVINRLKNDNAPVNLRVLDAEFSCITVLQGRTTGVPQNWISEFERVCDDEVKFLVVKKVSAPPLGTPSTPLKIGDVLLSVDGKVVKSMRDLSVMFNNDSLTFKIIRQKREMDITVPTIESKHFSTTHVVFWCGCILQSPHHAVRQLMEKIPSEIYITRKSAGGPALQYGIITNSFITHVNDKETNTLREFVKEIIHIPDNTYIKLRVVSYENIPEAISLKTNYHYYPTTELKKNIVTGEWKEIEHQK